MLCPRVRRAVARPIRGRFVSGPVDASMTRFFLRLISWRQLSHFSRLCEREAFASPLSRLCGRGAGGEGVGRDMPKTLTPNPSPGKPGEGDQTFSLWLQRGGAVYLLALLGSLLRFFHCLRDPSVWHDEAALIVNVLSKDFAALLGPLEWNEAAPPLFLWLERAVVLTLGDSTYALRLIPMLASCL